MRKFYTFYCKLTCKQKFTTIFLFHQTKIDLCLFTKEIFYIQIKINLRMKKRENLTTFSRVLNYKILIKTNFVFSLN